MYAVLTQPEQATPEWLTAILCEQGVLSCGQVVAVAAEPSTAWNSRAYHLDLRYSSDAPADAPRRLFLKLNLQLEWGREEVAFYQFVAQKRMDLPMLVGCFDAAYSADGGQSHLLLADVSDTHFTPVTKAQLLAGQTMPAQPHLEAMVDAIARLHAYWWEHSQLGNGFTRVRHWFDGEAAYRRHTERRQRAWATFQAQAGHRLPAETLCVVRPNGTVERLSLALPHFACSAVGGRFKRTDAGSIRRDCLMFAEP